ncbi:DNA cytosine methyltransferase [Flavobacterium tructae]|uniref:DNA cytosine methyltransferase n=1 Tax=Flavobacterium tructae TaxID=1114873 RepID=UPI002551D25B|nr:DNA (cytosine-5-)-methyltransferase [Flavobacterium tructae]MDL2143857.1 DNA cytosine methyltransferase [Flavobacterium tructae]
MQIVSLFSGAGGLDLGLIKAGHNIIWANDVDSDSCETYKLNIGKHIVCKDIVTIDSADIPNCEVVIGGFPCQGFSMANRLRKPDDERNVLYKQFYRVIKDKKPLYFLAENVRGILSMDNGNAIKTIVNDFTEAGYRVKYKTFNTADYGVPQCRMRVIIAGTRNDLNEDLDFKFPEASHDKKEWMSIEDALKGVLEPEDPKSKLKNHVYSSYKVQYKNYTAHRVTNPKKPSPTILARGNGKGGVCAIPHHDKPRRLSVRESAIIQTFPTSFEFVGSMSSMYRQVGNAVPVLFGQHLGEKLKELELVTV